MLFNNIIEKKSTNSREINKELKWKQVGELRKNHLEK